ncbi:hypothetical protein GQ42DRAFT_56333, partial [Ramicandelaber brevisporus]
MPSVALRLLLLLLLHMLLHELAAAAAVPPGGSDDGSDIWGWPGEPRTGSGSNNSNSNNGDGNSSGDDPVASENSTLRSIIITFGAALTVVVSFTIVLVVVRKFYPADASRAQTSADASASTTMLHPNRISTAEAIMRGYTMAHLGADPMAGAAVLGTAASDSSASTAAAAARQPPISPVPPPLTRAQRLSTGAQMGVAPS